MRRRVQERPADHARLVGPPAKQRKARGPSAASLSAAVVTAHAGWACFGAGLESRNCSVTVRITVFRARSRRRYPPAAVRNPATSPVVRHPMAVMVARGRGARTPIPGA